MSSLLVPFLILEDLWNKFQITITITILIRLETFIILKNFLSTYKYCTSWADFKLFYTSHPAMENYRVLRQKSFIQGTLFLVSNFVVIWCLSTKYHIDETKINRLDKGKYIDIKWIEDRIYLEIDLSPPSCNVTIVTAYYKIRSKHSNEEYLSWMTNFLTLQDCMVIFTQQDFVSTIETLRPADYQTIIVSIELKQEYYIISITMTTYIDMV